MTRLKTRLRRLHQKLPKTAMPRQVSRSQVENSHLEGPYHINKHHLLDEGHMMRTLRLESMFRIQFVSIGSNSILYV